jgi:Spy/CpxP family protein refolding chaperone
MFREALLFTVSFTAFAQANYQALKQALALTDVQTQQLQDLQKNRQEAAQAVYRKISDEQRQLNEALASPTPNPAAIGQLEIDVASLRKQIGAGPSVRDEVLAILTDAQKEKLKDLQNAIELQRAANEAIGLGLISAPPPVATPIRAISR